MQNNHDGFIETVSSSFEKEGGGSASKRVGLFTFSWANNYGALLQNYALESILRQRCDCVTVNYISKENASQYEWKVLPKIDSFRNFVKFPVRILRNIWVKKPIGLACDAFRNEALHLTQYIPDKSSLKKLVSEFDCVVTGSDQVLNSKLVHDDWDVYSLSLFKDIEKIGYAVSAGRIENIDNRLLVRGASLKEIGHLSVREKDLGDFFEGIGVDTSLVVDPVFLKSSADWSSLSNNAKTPYRNYIFIYMPDERCYSFALALAKKHHIGIIAVGFWIKRHPSIKVIRDAGPKEFVALIRNATYVVTGSFHATAFSILFHRRFASSTKEEKGGRIRCLLDSLSLESRILSDSSRPDMDATIPWDVVSSKVDMMRQQSLKWLDDTLDDIFPDS